MNSVLEASLADLGDSVPTLTELEQSEVARLFQCNGEELLGLKPALEVRLLHCNQVRTFLALLAVCIINHCSLNFMKQELEELLSLEEAAKKAFHAAEADRDQLNDIVEEKNVNSISEDAQVG